VTRLWLTKRELAAELRVSVSTIERINPPHLKVGGQNRYDPEEVYAALRGDNVVPLRQERQAA
jgi:hypothetical protein